MTHWTYRPNWHWWHRREAQILCDRKNNRFPRFSSTCFEARNDWNAGRFSLFLLNWSARGHETATSSSCSTIPLADLLQQVHEVKDEIVMAYKDLLLTLQWLTRSSSYGRECTAIGVHDDGHPFTSDGNVGESAIIVGWLRQFSKDDGVAQHRYGDGGTNQHRTQPDSPGRTRCSGECPQSERLSTIWMANYLLYLFLRFSTERIENTTIID